ncbi:MAG: acyl-CoA synthetase [Proteobacteria bacterium]|nr:acyl-CoA synthetase [Pseudomonadota bacterium]
MPEMDNQLAVRWEIMNILNYRTYDQARDNFTWDEVWDLFDGNNERFNIAHECIDRHVGKGTAFRLKFDDGHTEKYSFDEIAKWSSQFAHALKDMGIGRGDRVAVMLDPSREFYVSVFGILKLGAQVVPCFPLFAPENVAYRLKDSKAKLLVTTEEKALEIDQGLVKNTITVGDSFEDFIGRRPDFFDVCPTGPKEIAVLQYTSGTTKQFPSAIPHFHKSVYTATPNGVFVIGLQPGDRYFCPSSPAWGYGMWYGTTVPLALGIAVGSYSGRFSEIRIMEALEEFEINNFSAAPTVYRRMKNSGSIDNYKFKIKKMSYSGEPFDLDTFQFIKRVFGVSPCSFYGSTEVGVILSNFGGFDGWEVKPGSLGKPIMGLDVGVIDEQGNQVKVGDLGEIAVKRNGKWFYVKDIGVIDEDGYFWCKGRSDDVIISAGWTISSVEIESVISEHDAVVEAAVIAVPDEDRGQVAKAFIQTTMEPSQALAEEIQRHVKEQLGKFEYPRLIEFLDEIPKTEGGKIDRKKLRQMTGSHNLI